MLIERGYDPDPVLLWKEDQKSEQDKEAEAGKSDDEEDEPGSSAAQDSQLGSALAKDYDYLLSEWLTAYSIEYDTEQLKFGLSLRNCGTVA